MQTFNSNADSSAVPGVLQNILDVVKHKVSDQNGISYHHRQLVEEKAKIVLSNNSAIWRLPTEILAQIFLYCIPEDRNCTPAPYLTPVLLTTVCRRWREVALDMPSLWRRLRLEVGHSGWQQRAFCYDSYLKRSRGRQLSLTLEGHDTDWTELRSLLQPYIGQISFLSVGFFSNCGPLVLTDFHGLEELVIYNDANYNLVSAVVRSIAQLPLNTRSLKLMDLWPDFELLSDFNPLAWPGLTNLEIAVDELDCIPYLLCLCPNLLSLTVVGLFAVEAEEVFRHDKLQSLRISGDLYLDWVGTLGLFDAIILPSLRALEVRNSGQWPHEDFKTFLTQSQCPLESLIFGDGVLITEQQRAEYVTLLPSLKLVVDPTRSGFYF
ncbi:hypothetical protein BDR03DRAFT_1005432 [Suillus americanus]|nr:hypothetical protein BDR03DRAFT_1005432 [Suillus americanus]